MSTKTDTHGWQVGKSLGDCLRHMLDNHMFCDVMFEIRSMGKPPIRIPAHKIILQARSPVFEAMLATTETDGEVIITDLEAETFKHMLRYMYSDEVDLTGDNALPLLNAARIYSLKNLSEKCHEFLNKQISTDNVCSILTQSLVFQDEDLLNTCLHLIAAKTKAVVKTESFLKMSHDALLKVVRCDQLEFGVEAELFEACLQWAKRRVRDPDSPTDGEIRQLLGEECLHKIRFPFMSIEEFAGKFGGSSVITGEEKNLIYPLIATQQEQYSSALANMGFDITSRMISANIFQGNSGRDFRVVLSGETEEEFTFSVSKPIQLRGLSIMGGPKDAEHDVKISISNTTKGDNPYTTEHKIKSNGDGLPIPVYFRKTRIGAGTNYRMSVSVRGKENVGCCHGPLRSISVQGGIIITTHFHKHPMEGGFGGVAGYTAQFLFQRLPSEIHIRERNMQLRAQKTMKLPKFF